MSFASRLRHALASDLDGAMARMRAKTLGGEPSKPRPGEVRIFAARPDKREQAPRESDAWIHEPCEEPERN